MELRFVGWSQSCCLGSEGRFDGDYWGEVYELVGVAMLGLVFLIGNG